MTKYDQSTPPKVFFHCLSKANICDHDWGDWRDFPTGGEQVCTKCGMGAVRHSLTCKELDRAALSISEASHD